MRKNGCVLGKFLLVGCAAAVLAGCGGGGGGDVGGGGGNDIVRPQCRAPASKNPGNTDYDFLFPHVDAVSGQITLIDADDFGSMFEVTPHGVVMPKSLAVAQRGMFQSASGTIADLKPATLVYASGGEIYRVDLNAGKAGALPPVALTTNRDLSEVCAASIITVKVDDASSDYYLYSVPPASGECDENESSNNPAYRLNIGDTSGIQPLRPVDNARPVETLADPDGKTLLAIIALKGGNLNVYDEQYENPSLIVSDVSGVRDLYHALDVAFLLVTTGDGSEILRLEADGNGSLKPRGSIPLSSNQSLTAFTADSDSLYYALETGAGYSINRVSLSDQAAVPATTLLYEDGQAGDYVYNMQVTGDRLAFLQAMDNQGVGTLYGIDKGSLTTSGSAQRLDQNVDLFYPLFAANGHLYYTVIAGGELRARKLTDTGGLVDDFDRSAWFDAVLPQDRQAGLVNPAQVLLAAGYTGSGQTLSGAVLDSFPTAPNATCVTFNAAVGGQPTIQQRFNPVGIGVVTSGDGTKQVSFAFDASDGRLVELQ